MPIQYGDSIMEATKHCRSSASIFDVSHMLGSSIRGKDAVAFTESIVVGDIAGLKDGTGTLSVVTNEQGGIIDDTVVTKVNSEDIYIVLNGACSEKDQAHINKHLAKWKGEGKDVEFIVHSDRSLLAFQGPKAVDVLQPLCDVDLSKLYFGEGRGSRVERIVTPNRRILMPTLEKVSACVSHHCRSAVPSWPDRTACWYDE